MDRDFMIRRKSDGTVYCSRCGKRQLDLYNMKKHAAFCGFDQKDITVLEEERSLGYRLLIWDAYRPPEAQFSMWEVMPDDTYIADPYKGFSKHSRGNTVDVSLTDLEGNPVEMPSQFDDFTIRASRDYRHLDPVVRERILSLEKTMTENGFVPIYDEWWHYHDEKEYPICEGKNIAF